MNLQERIDLLVRLGEYIKSDNNFWQQAKEKASRANGWFIPEFIDLATSNAASSFLQKEKLEQWCKSYETANENPSPKKVGIVMAGNIPLVGFHDLLCVFITGHIACIKLSSKDKVLLEHLVATMASWNDEVNNLIIFSEMLKSCAAYIATGSNNSAGHFEYYFGKYPNIIRRNRTSVAILTGDESVTELENLADDVYLYFGLGCRNVTKIYVPENYDFVKLLTIFKKYNWLADHHKYKNNYDYNLAILLLNKKMYMSNESILLAEEASVFSPIGILNYEYFSDAGSLNELLKRNDSLQCIIGKNFIPFGQAQAPSLDDFADGVNTMKFLTVL